MFPHNIHILINNNINNIQLHCFPQKSTDPKFLKIKPTPYTIIYAECKEFMLQVVFKPNNSFVC